MLARAFARFDGTEAVPEIRIRHAPPDAANVPASKRTSRFATCPICDAAVFIHYLETHVNQHLDTLDHLRSLRPAEHIQQTPDQYPEGARHDANEDENESEDVSAVSGPEVAASEDISAAAQEDSGIVGNQSRPNNLKADYEATTEGDARIPPATHIADNGVYTPGQGVDFALQVMSGDTNECGICKESWGQGRERFMLWPCQHTRQCGECALKIWKDNKKEKRRCPWCKARLEIRPRAFRPFM